MLFEQGSQVWIASAVADYGVLVFVLSASFHQQEMYLKKKKGGKEGNWNVSLFHEWVNFKNIFISLCLCIPLVDPL